MTGTSRRTSLSRLTPPKLLHVRKIRRARAAS
jgi:hypothetical protein